MARTLPPWPSFFDGTQACAGQPLELFFPRRGGLPEQVTAQARAVCAGCHLTARCREYAINAQGVPGRWLAGIWGGTTDRERDAERRRRRQAAAAAERTDDRQLVAA